MFIVGRNINVSEFWLFSCRVFKKLKKIWQNDECLAQKLKIKTLNWLRCMKKIILQLDVFWMHLVSENTAD